MFDKNPHNTLTRWWKNIPITKPCVDPQPTRGGHRSGQNKREFKSKLFILLYKRMVQYKNPNDTCMICLIKS